MHKFPTLHEASLYAAQKRSEGYFAEVVHDHSGLMWGEGAFTFSVLVSDEKLDLECDEAEKIFAESSLSFPLWVSKFAFWIILIPSIIALIIFGIHLLRFSQILIYQKSHYLLQVILGIFTYCLFIALCIKFCQIYKNNSHPFHKLALRISNVILRLLVLTLLFTGR